MGRRRGDNHKLIDAHDQNSWYRTENPHLSPGSDVPAQKKIQNNTRKIQKIQFFWVVDNLMHEVRSKFQLIWTFWKLSAKKTNRVKIVRE